MRSDGTGKQLIKADAAAHDLNVAGDWIYYTAGVHAFSGMRKIRTDGTEYTELNYEW